MRYSAAALREQTIPPYKFPYYREKRRSAFTPLINETAGHLLSLRYDYGMMTMLISFPCHWRSIRVKTKTMPAGLFKSKCLAVMDEVQTKCETVIITKHGKPVAKLVPVDSDRDDFYGSMQGKITIVGDIVGPVIPEEQWNLD